MSFCKDCEETLSETFKIPLNRGTQTALRHTIYADDKKLFSFTLSDEDLQLLNFTTEAYIKQTLEKDFQTLTFYKTICK